MERNQFLHLYKRTGIIKSRQDRALRLTNKAPRTARLAAYCCEVLFIASLLIGLPTGDD